MPDLFTRQSLEALHDTVSAPEGVSLSELRELLNEFTSRDIAGADLQAFREGRAPWKKLRDEIVPVERFMSSRYPDDARVRFALNSEAPDAWMKEGSGEWVGIEVTGALARAGVEVGRTLATGKPVPGFIPLQDAATSNAFDRARARGRVVNSREAVDEAIDRAIQARLEGKDHEKFAGQILLIVAPIGSSPNRSVESLRRSHGKRARALPFAKVFVLDRGEKSPIIELT